MEQLFYLASCDPQGGILRCRLTGSGKIQLLQKISLDRPMWLCREGNRLYALLREPFPGESGMAVFDIQPDGKLLPVGSLQPTSGTIGCHAIAAWGAVYAAHYTSGTVTRLPDRILSLKQPHCLTRTPEGAYLCICDLGRDCVGIYTPELEEVSSVQLPPGTGPRHLVFSPDGRWAYCTNELSSTVSVFRYEKGKLTLVRSTSCIPESYQGENYPSAIRLAPDGKTLYAANRGHDSVCIWDVDGETLSGRRFWKTEGTWPREMNLLGNFLLCGNRDSITVFCRETGCLADRFPVANPWCILPTDGGCA